MWVHQTTALLLIGGRPGVGKSAVGNELHHLLVEREVMHGFIEGDNLDLAYPPPWEYGLAEANLGVMWRNYQALGHHRLIYANTLSVLCSDQLVAAIDGPARVTGVLLTATDDSVRRRLSAREVGSTLELHVRRSEERAAELDRDWPPLGQPDRHRRQVGHRYSW
jgi:broad-specificity NMP kinase